jgi:CRP/FNR family transcriptional regulator, cyclic AMP receptor protein
MISPEQLSRNWFFKGFTRVQLDALLALGRPAGYQKNTKILLEGDPAEFFYILVSGTVAIKMRAQEHGELVLNTLRHSGEIFGWSALVDEGRSTATVECLEKTEILAFRKKDAEALFLKDPALGYLFMQRLAILISRRLENTRSLLIKGIT